MSNLVFFKTKTTVGDKHVNEAMVANGYVLGGEQSDYIIFSKQAIGLNEDLKSFIQEEP